MSGTASLTNASENQDLSIPTDTEIQETFETLGLVGAGPMGYSYLSTWGAPAPSHVFEVTRTTTSAPRRA